MFEQNRRLANDTSTFFPKDGIIQKDAILTIFTKFISSTRVRRSFSVGGAFYVFEQNRLLSIDKYTFRLIKKTHQY